MKIEEVNVEMDRRTDGNFDEMFGEYTYFRKCVVEHGGLLLTAIKKDQKELAYNCYDNINYIVRVLTSTHSPLKNEMSLQADLVNLCEQYSRHYPSDYPQPKSGTCKISEK